MKGQNIIIVFILVLVATIGIAGIYSPGKTYDNGYAAGYRMGYDAGAKEIIKTISDGKTVDWTSPVDGWNGVIAFDHVSTKRNIPLEENPTCKVCHKYSIDLYNEKKRKEGVS